MQTDDSCTFSNFPVQVQRLGHMYFIITLITTIPNKYFLNKYKYK